MQPTRVSLRRRAPSCLPRSRALPGGRGADGFTLVEILVVLIIIALILGIAAPKMLGARHATSSMEVESVAHDYAEVVDTFALDHGGRLPVLGSADWPTASDGPVRTFATKSGGAAPKYLVHVPQPVQAGLVLIRGTQPTGAVPDGVRGSIRFVAAPTATPPTYRMEVWPAGTDGNYPSSMACYFGSYVPSQGSPCS